MHLHSSGTLTSCSAKGSITKVGPSFIWALNVKFLLTQGETCAAACVHMF